MNQLHNVIRPIKFFRKIIKFIDNTRIYYNTIKSLGIPQRDLTSLILLIKLYNLHLYLDKRINKLYIINW